ncbi:MAG: hypothetical protein M3R29_01895, partial [Verrucomicrobiota bacterium]|nr:hypothetical protein [Verrucomicrobiota bacterium]
MKPTSFITLTFCAFALGTAALATAASEPIAVQNTNNTSIALLTGEAFSWTGFYIGGNIGGSLNNYDFRGPFSDGDRGVVVDTVQQFNEEFGLESDQDGLAFFFLQHQSVTDGTLMGGGQVGFMYQFGHFVVGVEGDVDRLATSASSLRSDTVEGFFEPDETIFVSSTLNSVRRAQSTWNASARGRLGWAHGPFLVYGTGGIAWTDVKVWASDSASTNFFV